MALQRRRELIRDLEIARNSRVLSYVTSDRQVQDRHLGLIGDDALRPIYDRLRAIGRVERLDVFIYSRGGAIDVPWRLSSAFRAAAEEWNILVPFRANSAATLIALGADSIVLGRFGELGPIDPIMNTQRFVPQQGVVAEAINVEDVMSYVRFVKEKVGIDGEETLAQVLSKLSDRLDAVLLGSVFRTHSHIRDVARRMLLSRATPPDATELDSIIETLAERVYAHNHAIGLPDAQEIGLPAVEASGEIDTLLWALLREYEDDLGILSPIDPVAELGDTGEKHTEEDLAIAVVETAEAAHEFRGNVEIKAKRQVPPNLNVSLNLTMPSLPGVSDPAAIQSAIQQLVPQLHSSLLKEAQRALVDALKSQAPIVGAEWGFRGGCWKELN